MGLKLSLRPSPPDLARDWQSVLGKRGEVPMTLQKDQVVALLPQNGQSPRDVIRLMHVRCVGRFFVVADDGQIYSTKDGSQMYALRGRRIEPATEEHRAALSH